MVCIVVTLYRREERMLSPSSSPPVLKSTVFGFGKPKADTIEPTMFRNHGNTESTQITPKTLKNVCARAARFEVVFPIEAATFAAMVVPIFSPRIIAAAILNGMIPWVMSNMIIAIVAAEDWKQTVSKVPINKNIRTDTLKLPR